MPEFIHRFSKSIYRYCKTCDRGYTKLEVEETHTRETGEYKFGEEIPVCPVCKSDWAEPRIDPKAS